MRSPEGILLRVDRPVNLKRRIFLCRDGKAALENENKGKIKHIAIANFLVLVKLFSSLLVGYDF